nr:peptidylprolyl isomerase [Paraglaciecola sp. T6c]
MFTLFVSLFATSSQTNSPVASVAKTENSTRVVPQWRTPESINLVYMQLDSGLVIMELAPFMSPINVAQFKGLIKDGFYDGLDFYRVIDGFVAQGGDVTESRPHEHTKQLPAELTRSYNGLGNADDDPFVLVQTGEFMAPQTGFLNGFAAGRDPSIHQEWLLHCPGVVAFGRNNGLNTASSEFYIAIGQAPRHLDRNMSVLGKVIYGMHHVQRIKRASMNVPSGVIEDPTKRTKIVWARLANDIPAQQRVDVQVQDEHSDAVTTRIALGRTLENEFFHYKGNGNVDVCYYNLKTRIVE